MSEQKLLLSIKNLNISNGSQQLIKNFNLELAAGDYKVISAPTGTGKTTLFNYIAGILPHNTFKVSGELVKAPDLKVSYAFQEPRLISSISILKNVMLPLLNIMDPQRAESVARVWLERFKLSYKAQNLPESLSGGEKQRANLARAFAYAPGLLLLDEPFSSQDTDNAQNIQSLIQETLFIPNTAVLLITHDRTFLNDNSVITW